MKIAKCPDRAASGINQSRQGGDSNAIISSTNARS